MNEKQTNDERVYVWPDGTWCYECDRWEMAHKSDDYQVVQAKVFFMKEEI